jgi:hypothetical protein
VSKPDAADQYAAWVERTAVESFPAGDDMSALAELGETRYRDVPAYEIARRVAVARERTWTFCAAAATIGQSKLGA